MFGGTRGARDFADGRNIPSQETPRVRTGQNIDWSPASVGAHSSIVGTPLSKLGKFGDDLIDLLSDPNPTDIGQINMDVNAETEVPVSKPSNIGMSFLGPLSSNDASSNSGGGDGQG